jgi:phosphatidate cytidylyltransferase
VGLWVLVGVALGSGQAWACLGLMGLLSVVATIEYFRMVKAAGVECFPSFGALVAVGYSGVVYWLLMRSGAGGGFALPGVVDAAAIYTVMVGAVVLRLRVPVRDSGPVFAVGVNLLGFVYLGLMFNFVARLLFLVPGEGEMPGLWLVLWVVAVTKFTDMGAYITGTAIGKHKMIPHISPGKTWQGFGGALVFAQLAACGLWLWIPEKLSPLGGWGHVVFLGLALALLAVLGDLAGSIIKRSLKAKDSGSVLPGIGGSFDLIDSICFTVPFFYFYLKWLIMK